MTLETKKYTVTGMTCGHCEASVREEILELGGITEVTADHTNGAVSVTGEQLDDAKIHAAVAEAGYEVVQP